MSTRAQRQEIRTTHQLRPAATQASAGRQITEVGVAYALLQIALWSPRVPQFWWATALALWVSAVVIRSGRNREDLGLSLIGLLRAFWVVPGSLAVSGLMIVAAHFAGTLHSLRGAHDPLLHSSLYVIWALVQEFLAQAFFFVWLESAFRNSHRAVLATAFLFCLAHIPNLVLMAATLAMGLLWSELFCRYRNIYPLAVAHGILGITLSMTLPEYLTHRMRVGIAFFY